MTTATKCLHPECDQLVDQYGLFCHGCGLWEGAPPHYMPPVCPCRKEQA